MTRAEFVAVLTPLALGLRADVDGPTWAVYHQQLGDIPTDVLAAAVGRGLETRIFFPTPLEIRMDCDVVAVRPSLADDSGQMRALPAPVDVEVPQAKTTLRMTREWKYYCEACNDSGWRSLWCGAYGPYHKPWIDLARCERRHDHQAHEFVVQCACYESNPALIRKRENQRKYAKEPAKVGR